METFYINMKAGKQQFHINAVKYGQNMTNKLFML